MRRADRLRRWKQGPLVTRVVRAALFSSLLSALLLSSQVQPVPAQALPPGGGWRSLEGAHARVTFSSGLEEQARHVLRVSERAYENLSRGFVAPPGGKIDLVLADHVDFTNGYATFFPSNRIVLYAHPPVGQATLGYYEDHFEILVTHEMTHIFHLDETGRVGGFLRRVFGRPPLPWPFFPVAGLPGWNIEGTAVHFESAWSGYGRIPGSYFDMVLRAAVLEDRFDGIDRASSITPIWPGGNRHYIYGSHFTEFLARREGPDAARRVLGATASSIVPPPLAFNRVGRRALGRSFSASWRDWRKELGIRYEALADSLTSVGLTTGEPILDAGYHAGSPRISPDGRTLAVAFDDGKHRRCTLLLDLETGARRDLHRRNSLGAASWLPSGEAILLADLEYAGPYHVVSDLYLVDRDGSERRLTRGARLLEPDVAPDSRRVVAVESGRGSNRLILFDLESRGRVPLTDWNREVQWSRPRWSPDGGRIAVSRQEAGRLDLVLLDSLGVTVARLTEDRALDMDACWSRDGRYLFFTSDRTGIPNLYACDVTTEACFRITNVLTGAYAPEVSPDGRWMYYSAYHADGYRIERMPLDPARWTRVRPEPTPSMDRPSMPVDLARSVTRPYRPLRSALPRFWLPALAGNELSGYFYGAFTQGEDLIGRHAYTAMAAYNPRRARVQGSLDYTYLGLGQPYIGLGLDRFWDAWEQVLRPGNPATRVDEREDNLRLFAGVRRYRYNSVLSASITGERVARQRYAADRPDSVLLQGSRDELLGLVAGLSWSNARSYPFSISAEEGGILRLTGRRRWDQSSGPDESYWEARGSLALYRGLPLFGFARHVLAGRVNGLWRTGPGAGNSSLGGVSSEAVNVIATSLGGPSTPLFVRGFRYGVRRGSRAWASSLEYRLPLALIGRGPGLIPVFLDRLSAAAFLDAGDSWCEGRDGTYRRCGDAVGPDGASLTDSPLIGAGGELIADTVFFYNLPVRLRCGAGIPLRGPGEKALWYVALGRSF